MNPYHNVRLPPGGDLFGPAHVPAQPWWTAAGQAAQQVAEEHIWAAGNYMLEKAAENPMLAAKAVAGAATYGFTSAAVTATGAVKAGATRITDYYSSKKRNKEGNPKYLRSPAADMMEIDSQSNPPATTQATAAMPQISQPVQNGDDVPLQPFGRLAKTAPDYFTIKLPYATVRNFSASGGVTKFVHQFRLNSIFDVDVTSPGNQQPQGRDLWTQIYQYYRVIRSDWKITYFNNNTQLDRDSRLLVGFQWAEEEAASSQFADDKIAKLCSKRSRQIPLLGKNCDQGGNVATLQYSYDEASFDHHINENQKNTIWTAIGQSPDLKRTLQVDLHNMQDAADKLDATILVEVQYTVQFREAANSLIKGPVDDN